MKLTIKLMLATVIAFLTISATAQTNLSFFTSRAIWYTTARDAVRSSQEYVWTSESDSQTPWASDSWTTNRTMGEIISFFNTTKLRVPILNTNDYVYLVGNSFNSDGDQLFSGSGYSYITNGKLVKPDITLYLSYYAPLKFDKSINYAEFWFTDPITGQSTQVSYFYNVNGNKLWLPVDWAGLGMLTLHFNDGTTRTYDLRNRGQVVTPTTFEIQANSTVVDNYHVITNGSVTIVETLPSYNGKGDNHVYEYHMTEKGYLGMQLSTSEGYHPLSCNVKLYGTTNWMSYAFSPDLQGVLIPMDLNKVYDIIPVWDPNQFSEPDPYTGGDGGGKG